MYNPRDWQCDHAQTASADSLRDILNLVQKHGIPAFELDLSGQIMSLRAAVRKKKRIKDTGNYCEIIRGLLDQGLRVVVDFVGTRDTQTRTHHSSL